MRAYFEPRAFTRAPRRLWHHAVVCATALALITLSLGVPASGGTNSAGLDSRKAGTRCFTTDIESREILGSRATKIRFTSGDATVVPQLIRDEELIPQRPVQTCYVGKVSNPSGIAFAQGTGTIFSGPFLASWYTKAESELVHRKGQECRARLGRGGYYNLTTHQCDVL